MVFLQCLTCAKYSFSKQISNIVYFLLTFSILSAYSSFIQFQYCYKSSIVIQMGNASKSLYSKQELLYYHINRKQYEKINSILLKQPNLIDKPITKDTKHTLLMRAVFSVNLQSVEFVLEKGANPNIVTHKGETALTIAIQKNNLSIVDKLLQYGANANLLNTKNGLKPVDLAILPGFLDIAKSIYTKMDSKQLKETFQYEELAKKYHYRYVNYKLFLKMLTSEEGVEHEAENNYLQKERIQLYDPVPDPRESWGEWFKRNADFKDAPLVQRNSLPPQLQPQNRKLGKLDTFVHNLVKSDVQKKVSYKPKQGRQVMSEMNDLVERKQRKEGAPDYQSAV